MDFVESSGVFLLLEKLKNWEAGMTNAGFPDPGITSRDNFQKHLLPGVHFCSDYNGRYIRRDDLITK
jgi:hypothetical protein